MLLAGGVEAEGGPFLGGGAQIPGVAREKDRDVMWLGVWEYNPRAQRFYEKNGFRIVGSHVFVLGEDPQTDLLMQREL